MSFRIKARRAKGRKAKSSRGSAHGPKSLAQRLYAWRKKNDFSQNQAALKLQISKRTLQEWEQGRAEPQHLALDAINVLIGR